MEEREVIRLKEMFLTATLALRYEVAAQRVLLAARRLRDAWERHYNPNWALQPRVLTGLQGGQWTNGGTSSEGEQRLVAAKNPDIKYIEYLLSKYHIFDRKTRRRIHDEITRQDMSREELELYISGFAYDG